MSLLFIGIDPNTRDHESPTVWVDQEKQELVFQGWKPEPELEAECARSRYRATRWASPNTRQ